jgi:Fe-S oxidoreductase
VTGPRPVTTCTDCGACAEECPVHIEHIDGMRRRQLLAESAFPQEAAGMPKNLENWAGP